MLQNLKPKTYNLQPSRGFTLIEVIVAAAIFSLVLVAVSNALLVAIQAQTLAIVGKNTSESTRFALAYMSRQMRFAQRYDSLDPAKQPQDCITTFGDTFEYPASDDIHFINAQGQCIRFYYDAGTESIIYRNITNQASPEDPINLTNQSQVEISRLEFIVDGESASDTRQPRVTTAINARKTGPGGAPVIEFNAQTTVVTRRLDTPLTPPPAGAIFYDTFNRGTDPTLGDPAPGPGTTWDESTENATHRTELDADRLFFYTDDLPRIPNTWSTFSRQTSGTLRWTYDFSWVRTGSEGTYEVFMQLGDSSIMNPGSLTAGVAANVRWGDNVGACTNEACFGFESAAGTDVQLESIGCTYSDCPAGALPVPAAIEVIADLDARTYSIKINGNSYAAATDVPFRDDANVAGIDEVRFILDRVAQSNFVNDRHIDNVLIVREGAGANNPPTVTLVADAPDPVTVGHTLNFVVNYADPNPSDQVRAWICKTNSFNASVPECTGGAANTLEGPSPPDSDGTILLQHVALAAEIGISNPYWVFVCDNGTPIGCSFTKLGVTDGTFDVLSAGNALDFTNVPSDSTGDYVEVPSLPDMAVAEGTLETWFYARTLGGGRGIFSRDRSGCSGDCGHFQLREDGSRIEVRLQNNGSDYYVRSPIGSISTGQWYFVSVSFGPGNLKLYLNGQLITQNTSMQEGINGNLEPTAFGASTGTSGVSSVNPTSSHFDGLIDEMRFYDRQLSDGDIALHYNNGEGTYGCATDPDLVAGWHFDEAAGINVSDFSTSGTHDGTIQSSQAPDWVGGWVGIGSC